MVQGGEVVTPEMVKQFHDPGEPVIFQSKVVKLSRFNIE